jgi:hypothetical protein
VNPVEKVRSGATSAWRGTTRTAKWAAGGVAAGPKRAAGAIGGATRGARDRVRGGARTAWRSSGGAGAVERTRSNPRIAIAWAAGILLVVAWVGWAIYVTVEHGGSAGLGVLISWPVAIAALALIAAPFVGVYLLVQRLREPALAGPAGGLASGPDRARASDEGKTDGDDEGDEGEGEGEGEDAGDLDEGDTSDDEEAG